jgi:hypothetical protein
VTDEPGWTIKVPKFLEVKALAQEMLPEPETDYILRLGDIQLFSLTMDICVKLEIDGEIGGLVRTFTGNLIYSFFIGSNSNTECQIEYALRSLYRAVPLPSLLSNNALQMISRVAFVL